MQYWFDFCDEYSIDYTDLNNTTAGDFVAWCFTSTPLNGATASKALTSVTSILCEEGVEWKRKDCPYIGRLITGFTKLKPPKKRVKRPFTCVHVALVWKHCIDLKDLDRFALGLGILIGYSAGLRPEQISRTKNKRNIRISQLTFRPNYKNCEEITINIRFSKTNQLGLKEETMDLECCCNRKILDINVPCPVHHLIKYLNKRRKIFGYLPWNSSVLVYKDGSSVLYAHLNNFMFNCILKLNEIYKINMNPAHYTPHSLRVGGCTDKARLNWPGWRIEKWGRWSSKIWKETYIKMKFDDIAALLGVTVSFIKKNMTVKPYSD